MTVARFDTAGNIVRKAALELGLGSVGANVFASDDPNIQQLIGLLGSCGQELALAYDWPQLRMEHRIVTAAEDTGDYLMPADYNGYCVRTAHDRTLAGPLYGPLTSGEWQLQKVQTSTGLITGAFRIDAPVFRLLEQPAVGTEIFLEYKSKAWVIPATIAGATLVYKSVGATNGATDLAADGDVCLFDPLLLLRYLKLAFRTEKGFDTTSQLAAFMGTLHRAAERATPGPKLTFGCRRKFPLIGGEGTPYEGPVIPTQGGLDQGGVLDDGELA